MKLLLLCLLSVPLFAQSGTIVFNTTDGANMGTILHDGTLSNDISGIQIDIFSAMTAGDADSRTNSGSFAFLDGSTASLSENTFYSIDVTTGNQIVVSDNLPKIMVIMSNDETEFSFQSIYVGDYIASESSIKFEGFRNGTSTGSVTLAVNGTTFEETFTSADFPVETFGNIDELRVTNQQDGDMTHGNYAGFNNIEIGAPILPVELSSFTAKLMGNQVHLAWQTSSETNNYGFEIEKNSNGIWSKIGFVTGMGNSSSIQNYSFTDAIQGTKSYYRLKQIDHDGSFQYSEEIEVSSATVYSYSLKQNYPNPFNPGTAIEFSIPADENVKILLYDVLGNEVDVILNEFKPAGLHKLSYNASALPSGVYFYKLTAGSFSQVHKMILQK